LVKAINAGLVPPDERVYEIVTCPGVDVSIAVIVGSLDDAAPES
jgi:hypothetical protein